MSFSVIAIPVSSFNSRTAAVKELSPASTIPFGILRDRTHDALVGCTSKMDFFQLMATPADCWTAEFSFIFYLPDKMLCKKNADFKSLDVAGNSRQTENYLLQKK